MMAKKSAYCEEILHNKHLSTSISSYMLWYIDHDENRRRYFMRRRRNFMPWQFSSIFLTNKNIIGHAVAKYGVRTGTEACPYVGSHTTELGMNGFGVVAGPWGSPSQRCCRGGLFGALFRWSFFASDEPFGCSL